MRAILSPIRGTGWNIRSLLGMMRSDVPAEGKGAQQGATRRNNKKNAGEFRRAQDDYLQTLT
jgi:hypothetical protein